MELEKLENDDKAQNQPLQSYIMVPNQRVMRMPMLMEMVLKQLRAVTHVDTDEYAIVKRCFETLRKVCAACYA